jgi:hypothetical protein
MRGEDVPSLKGGRKKKKPTALVEEREKLKEEYGSQRNRKKAALVNAAGTLLDDSEILVRVPEFLLSLARVTLTQSAHVMKFPN